MARNDGVRVSLKAMLPEAHIRHVARLVLEGTRRHSEEAEEWLSDQKWFRDWVGDSAREMVEGLMVQAGWEGRPAEFWPDQPKDIPGAEWLARNLSTLPITAY